jgi:hypothetical protein
MLKSFSLISPIIVQISIIQHSEEAERVSDSLSDGAALNKL